ncbi:MAG: hypothetical protein JSU77_03885 [Fidelibacterota bacterium]|nr:MAG: hypothetical protein JSU77_03885 [Candidatus Neomarinimicrobiota bacterium]
MKRITSNRQALGMFIFLGLVFVTAGCRQRSQQIRKHEQMIGVKVYAIEQAPAALFQYWDELGINTVFAAPSLLNTEFRMSARAHQIETFIIVPIFFDPDTLHLNPDLYAVTKDGNTAVEEWVEFVCPSRKEYRERKIETIRTLIRELDPDGLSLDFIRHFVFWEKVYPDRQPENIPNTCFDSQCLQKFQMDLNLSIPDSLSQVPEIAAWIRDNYLAEWTEWKCGLITGMIREIVDAAREINPGIKINVHAVPWRQDDFGNAIRNVVGQDFSKIAPHVDMLSPMTYAHMVKQKPEWVNSVVEDLAGMVKCRIIPSIQVNEAYLTEPLTVAEFEKSLIAALKKPSSGVIFWSWEQLVENPEKMEILRFVLKNNR